MRYVSLMRRIGHKIMNNQQIIPSNIRMKGRVIQIDDKEFPENNDKWFFQLFMGEFGKGEPEELGVYGPFECIEIAEKEMKNAVKMICDKAFEHQGQDYDGMVDLKTNKFIDKEKF